MELLTLSALPPSEARTAVTVSGELQRTHRGSSTLFSFHSSVFLQPAPPKPHHVAVSSQRVLWVTATWLAAPLLTVVPVVWGALVAVVAGHILPAGAGARLPVAVTMSVAAGRLDGAGRHAGTA